MKDSSSLVTAAIQDVVTLPFEEIVKGEIERGEKIYNDGYTDIAGDIRNSLGGGPCWRCQTPWKEVVCDNRFQHFTYYMPACDCYPICRKVVRMESQGKAATGDIGCGRVLYEEFDGPFTKKGRSHTITCMNCGTVINIDRFLNK